MASVATAPVRIAVIQSQSTNARSSPVVESKSIISLFNAGTLPTIRDTTFVPKRLYSLGSRQGIVVKKSFPEGCTDIFAGSWQSLFMMKASRTQSIHCSGDMFRLIISLLVILFMLLDI
jgi:hypothetical protein